MSAPTYGLFTDAYTAAQVTAGLPGGLQFGQTISDLQTGKQYMFCKADAAISQNRAVKTDPGGTAGQQYNVVQTAATTDFMLGVCETIGGIASGGAGWITIGGPASCLTINGTAQGQLVGPSVVSGQLANGSTHVRAECLTAPGGSPIVVPIYLV